MSISVASWVLASGALATPVDDARELYDVLTYRLDLRVDPGERRIDGIVYIELEVVGESLDRVSLDLMAELEVRATRVISGELTERAGTTGRGVQFRHEEDVLEVRLEEPRVRGEVVVLGIEYGGRPESLDRFTGVHWAESADGTPWISTSVQSVGSRVFWPCKDSFFHPEDKPDRVWINLTVPRGLVAVSNGRLAGRSPQDEEWETFHWVHPYPCETYAVTVNVGPFVTVEKNIELPGIDRPVTFAYYVMPEDLEKANVQFEEVPALLAIYSEHFGPWPFPDAKVGIVHTSFWGMEHSTAIAYGSSFPRWREQNDRPDPWAHRNRLFDYVLIHELSHEWWGNAVSASDWGHFWIHEGFGTYGEAVVVEARYGREEADDYFDRMRSFIAEDSRLYRGAGASSEDAYGAVIYAKGAWLLHTLRHYLDDDVLWWRVLREFNLRHRYGNADTEDFRALLEEVSGENWERFFDEWFYGAGYPTLTGEVRAEGNAVIVAVENPVRHDTPFHVPLDVVWYEGEFAVEQRVHLEPGTNTIRIPCAKPPEELAVIYLERLLGEHSVTARDS